MQPRRRQTETNRASGSSVNQQDSGSNVQVAREFNLLPRRIQNFGWTRYEARVLVSGNRGMSTQFAEEKLDS